MDVTVSLLNLFDTPINNYTLHLWFAPGLTIKTFPDNCEYGPSTSNLTNLTGLDASTHLVCTQDIIERFGRSNTIVNIEITDSSAT